MNGKSCLIPVLNYENVEENKSEQKWSNTFVNEDLNWKKKIHHPDYNYK